jgi:hypothetical protein
MASHSIHDLLHEGPSHSENMEVESEPEDEVDQLDSESDADASELDTSLKNGSGGGERLPGHTLIPALRLENIILSDGKSLSRILLTSLFKSFAGVAGNLAVSKEGLFILSIATVSDTYLTDYSVLPNDGLKEEFIMRMAGAGHLQASSERRNSVNYRDMGESHFDFP